MKACDVQRVETHEAKRERLILAGLPHVYATVQYLKGGLPASVGLDDLVSAGVVGLISAVDNFDENAGVKLKTYAEYRIRGAILDSVRELDWASRNRRKKAKEIESAISHADSRLHRAPTEDEVAAELGLTLAEYRARQVEVQGLSLQSFSDNQWLLSLVPDTEEGLPSKLLERAELERLLAEAIKAIPETAQTILALYYNEEYTLRQIANILGMHSSYVSALKSQAILRLRSTITKKWPGTRGR